MSAYNTVACQVTCPVCRKCGTFEVQFKFGDTWQYRYGVGDRLTWGGNDYGTRSPLVEVDGLGGPCPHCGSDYIDFIITVRDDIIMAVQSR
jgi:hypothetical protein